MKQAVVVDCCRTPIGRAHPEKGAFRDVRSDDLAVVVVSEPIDGHIDGWDNEDVGEVEHINQQPQAGGTMSVFKFKLIFQ